jgi:hypothetical protein
MAAGRKQSPANITTAPAAIIQLLARDDMIF